MNCHILSALTLRSKNKQNVHFPSLEKTETHAILKLPSTKWRLKNKENTVRFMPSDLDQNRASRQKHLWQAKLGLNFTPASFVIFLHCFQTVHRQKCFFNQKAILYLTCLQSSRIQNKSKKKVFVDTDLFGVI